ncbi:hypothetical protein QMM96_04890 [Citrobacter freundii]|uniref:hypothetical protein n=1 Tax=Citrobacter freundii TaxID=546 RepID=UPI002B23F7DB|nr:hypothetical protein [Citrobacter freundii]MEB2474782.1 hypothetical protein [Citrobacter freundii]
MSTISKEFTKEQLIEKLQHRISVASGFPESEKAQMDLELARIALASLEAEAGVNHQPVAWQYKEYVHVRGLGYLWREKLDCEFPGAECETLKDVVPLYIAPPAPVSVMDEAQSRELFEKNCMANIERNKWHPDLYAHLPAREQWAAWEACRSVMLQGAEPVTTANKLRDAVEIIRNSGIEIGAEKIFAERDALNAPDCWCRACRPITLTDMRFVVCPDCGNKRCPHANDHRNGCTGSNEPGQEGSAYPAAPQQEAKNV